MEFITYIISFIVTALIMNFLMCIGKNRIRFDENGIVIMEGFIPLKIRNNQIKSMKLVNELPHVLSRVHAQGFGIGNRRRGSFLVGKTPVQLFLDNAKNSTSFIQIETVNGLIYINLKNDELTENLFSEMSKTVRIVDEYELAEPSANKYRIIGLTIGLVVAIALIICYIFEK